MFTTTTHRKKYRTFTIPLGVRFLAKQKLPTLPGYFHLINIDFRYQLTIIGTSFARAVIFSEIDENNQFVIKTDEPNTKVSWQVTAKRNDQRMIDNPFSDVVDK